MALYDTVTTVFEPDATCFEPSNLWLTSVPCATQYSGFASKPNIALTSLTCPITLLGPPQSIGVGDYSCYPYNIYTTGGTAWSDCPMSMTAVDETTSEWYSGIKVAITRCCPSAYEFVSNYDPTPQVVGDSTYPVQAFGSFLCRATAVGAFSDQTATLTVSTAPLITTEVPWDYDVDMILAYPANINRYIYEGSGTTSECFGRCPETSNPLAPPTPTPTFAPTNSYVSPPSHATTQFTPAPSCLSDPNLWLVSTSCQLLDNNQIETPPWLECAITEFGEPNVSNEACYPGGSATAGDDETTSFYVDCPAGYTTASETTYRPFDETQYGETPRATVSYDVVASAVMCCPDVENYSFQYSDVTTTTTTHDYRSYDVHMYPMPFCVATSVEALSGRDVELTLTVDTRVWDKKKRQEETSAPAVTIRPWDYEGGLLFAQAAGAAVTVFHGTYTCLESCSEYFTYSYNNTDPNYTPPPSTTSTAASSISAAEPTTTTSGAGESVVTGEATGSVVFTGSGNQLCETKPGTAALTVAVLMLLYRAML